MMQLHIFYDKIEVGILKYEPIEDIFSFEYTDNWKIDGFELSPYMKFDSLISNNAIKILLKIYCLKVKVENIN